MLPRVSAERPREISMCRDRASPLVPAHIREARHGRRNQTVVNGGGDAFPKHICVHQDFLFGSRTSKETTQIRTRIFRKRGSLSLLGLVVPSLSFWIRNARRSER